MININGKNYLTLSEVSKIFSVQKNTVSTWRRQGKIDFIKLTERKYVFPESFIMELFGE